MNKVRSIFEAKKFSISKLYEKDDDNKDSVDFDVNSGVFCISDGVSGASFSEKWSRLIVSNFIKNPFVTNNVELLSWVGPIQLEWYKQVPWEELELKNINHIVKAYRGASATLLGGQVLKIDKQIILKLWAIGDSNLFIIRDSHCIFSFPIDNFEDFEKDPDILLSLSDKVCGKNICVRGSLIFKKFNLQKDDIIIAASDSISAWFLRNRLNSNDQPWIELCNINNIDEFKTWVINKVESKNMKNDDSTLLVIRISEIIICEKCEKEKNSATSESCMCGIKKINNLKFLFKKKIKKNY